MIGMYVPVLKGKAAEFKALKMLFVEAAIGTIPFIDVPGIELKKNGKEKTSLETHLKEVCSGIRSSWNTDFYIDLSKLDSDRKVNGQHVISYVRDYFAVYGLSPMFAIGLNRSEGYLRAIKELIVKSDVDICLRLFEKDMHDLKRSTRKLDDLLNTLQINKSRIHVMLDLRTANSRNVSTLSFTAIRSIISLIKLGFGDTFIVVAGSVPSPSTLSKLRPDQVHEFVRYEKEVWKSVFKNLKKKNINLYLGDYGVIYWDYFDVKSGIRPSAKIRYTTTDKLVIAKGHRIKRNDTQYVRLAKIITRDERFSTESYSWGDGCVANCANDKKYSSLPKDWIAIDTNHHITFAQKEVFIDFDFEPVPKKTLVGQTSLNFKI